MSMIKKIANVEKLPRDPKDVLRLIKGEMTVGQYAKKYDMTIEHARNFKKLYSTIEKIKEISER